MIIEEKGIKNILNIIDVAIDLHTVFPCENHACGALTESASNGCK